MKTLLLIAFVLGQIALKAQSDSLAIIYYEQGKLMEAKYQIDKAVKNARASKNTKIWYVRGFIYKDLYKQNKAADSLLALRLEAVHSFKKLIELDSKGVYRDDGVKNLKYLAQTFFNDAVTALSVHKFELSQQDFAYFKTTMELVDTSMNLKKKEVEYYLALASTYTKIYERKDANRSEFLQKAKDTYIKVLDIEPKNVKANYNMGVLYYNEAVNIIIELDYNLDLQVLSDAEDRSIVLFKQSLPFMENAYEQDPDNKNTLEGLSGIYFSLKEFEKSDKYKKKMEKLK